MKSRPKVRIMYAAFCLALLCAVAIPAHAAPITLTTPTSTPAPRFPLKKSTDNRYLVTQDGIPFLIVGDAGWYLSTQGRYADIDTYLANRAAKGFSAIILQLIDSTYSDRAPNDIDGIAPFTTPGNFSTYNPTYFNKFDYVVDRAAAYGMVVVTFPLFLGYNCGSDGFANQVIADTTAHLQSYGTFLGNRYRNKGNIIWVMAGDANPTCAAGLSAKVNAFATALVTADPNHLVTEHNSAVPGVGSEAVTPWLPNVPSWLTLNTTYGPSPLSFSQGLTAWNRTPTRPFFHIEGYYENDPHVLTRQQLRSQSYWSMLTNTSGTFFGNCPVYGLSSTRTLARCGGGTSDWHVAMNQAASVDMTRLKNLFTALEWQKLVPDFTHTVVTAGYGNGTTTVTTSRASDGSFVASYLPALSGVTVNMTRITGPGVVARWYDPTNGAYTTVSGSPFPNTGVRIFTPTGNNSSGASDWVLLLQSSASPTPTPTPGGDVIIDFSDRTLNEILSGRVYKGVTWGAGTPDWRIWYDATFTKSVYVNSHLRTQVNKTLICPSGAILKSVKVANFVTSSSTVTFSSSGNPDRTLTNVGRTYSTLNLNWINPANTVTVKITCNGAHGAADILFDDIKYFGY
jgi:hypothetical protein